MKRLEIHPHMIQVEVQSESEALEKLAEIEPTLEGQAYNAYYQEWDGEYLSHEVLLKKVVAHG